MCNIDIFVVKKKNVTLRLNDFTCSEYSTSVNGYIDVYSYIGNEIWNGWYKTQLNNSNK